MSNHAAGRPGHREPRDYAVVVRVLRYVVAVYLGAAALGGLLAGDWLAALFVALAAALVWPSPGLLPFLDARGGRRG